MNIRIATIEDSGAIRAVYAPYIDTPVTFETALPTIEEFEGRVAGILPEYPYLVCEKDGRIIGYAYACRHRERAAYRWNTELSVYLDGAFVAKGLGRRLYEHSAHSGLAWGIYRTVVVAAPVLLLLLATMTLVGDSYNPFLYWKF